MIRFTDNDAAIRVALSGNPEYMRFVQSGCPDGYIFIQVGDGHVVLYHNNDDVFTSYLLPDELFYYRNNLDDIRRIANSIQNFATQDYRTNVNP